MPIRRKEKRTKRKDNIRALSRIQLICNENYDFLNDSVYSIDQILKVFKEARERNQSPFSENRLDKITNDKNILLDLLNNDFVNDYFSYTIMIEKHNKESHEKIIKIALVDFIGKKIGLTNRMAILRDNSFIRNFEKIKTQFISLDYIDITTKPYQSKFDVFWSLTERGKRHLADLLAIKKN